MKMALQDNTPKRINKKQVKDNVLKVVEAMSRLRARAIADRELEDDDKNKYLSLAGKLAQEITDFEEERIHDLMVNVTKAVGSDSRLLFYDNLQDRYWEKHNKKFEESLDKLVIATLRDGFDSMEAKHHVFQAVKFLSVVDSKYEDKDRMYGTILPSHGRVEGFKEKKTVAKTFGKTFGTVFKVEDLGNKLKVDGDVKFIDKVVEQAKDMGYGAVQMDVFEKDVGILIGKGYNVKKVEDFGDVVPKDPEKVRSARNLIRKTAVISYPILGSLPKSVQERIEEYTKCDHCNWGRGKLCKEHGVGYYKSNRGTLASAGVIGALSVTGGVTASLLAGTILTPVLPFAVYGLIESLIRSATVLTPDPLRPDDNSTGCGSLPVKILSLPLDILSLPLDIQAMQNRKEKEERGRLCRIEVILNEKEDNEEELLGFLTSTNLFDYFSKIASINVPENLESNLVWSAENHHTYAKDFANHLDRRSKEIEKNPVAIKKNIDKKNQVYNIFDEKLIDHYKKVTVLACSKGKRYVLSMIGHKDLENYLEKVNVILTKEESDEEKTKDLAKELNLEYAHLAKFLNCTLADEYEVLN